MSDDNVVVLVANELCGLCGRQRPICAEVDMHIRYRELPNDVFRAQLKLCPACCDAMHLDPDEAKEAMELPPVPTGEMCPCGKAAVILTGRGKLCADCAF